MFFQVRMKKQDQWSHINLWNHGNPDNEPEVYAVAVIPFGAACSPNCAHYVKNMNAERFEVQHPWEVYCIKYEHYVDDILASVETQEEAMKLARVIRTIHSQGGFEIRNWLSNMSFCTEMSTGDVKGAWYVLGYHNWHIHV